MSKVTQRLESPETLRAIVFMLMFLFHVELIATGPVGVSLFLLLSGFCIIYAYLDRPEKIPSPVNNFKFIVRKKKKLYPLCLVMFLCGSYHFWSINTAKWLCERDRSAGRILCCK